MFEENKELAKDFWINIFNAVKSNDVEEVDRLSRELLAKDLSDEMFYCIMKPYKTHSNENFYKSIDLCEDVTDVYTAIKHVGFPDIEHTAIKHLSYKATSLKRKIRDEHKYHASFDDDCEIQTTLIPEYSKFDELYQSLSLN